MSAYTHWKAAVSSKYQTFFFKCWYRWELEKLHATADIRYKEKKGILRTRRSTLGFFTVLSCAWMYQGFCSGVVGSSRNESTALEVKLNTRCISLDWFKDMIEEAGICTVVIYRLVNVSKGREKLIQSCTDTLPTELLHTQIWHQMMRLLLSVVQLASVWLACFPPNKTSRSAWITLHSKKKKKGFSDYEDSKHCKIFLFNWLGDKQHANEDFTIVQYFNVYSNWSILYSLYLVDIYVMVWGF